MTQHIAITNACLLGGGTSLLIEGDRIAGHDLPIPAGAKVIDAKGAHVAPGIVDLGVFSVDKRACIAGGITRIALMRSDFSNPVLFQVCPPSVDL